MDPVSDNPTANNGTADNNAAGTNSITDIMGSMTASTTPEAKPENNEGKPAEGTENSQTGTPPAWTSQLPEDMRTNADVMKQLGKFGKIGDLAKSYSELEAKLGNSIVRPGKEATPEETEAFYRKLGKPETADKYTIEGDAAAAFRELAYKNNLSDEQAKGMYQMSMEIAQKQLQQSQDQLLEKAAATENTLKKEFGNDFQSKMEMCRRGVIAYGGPALGKKLQDSGLLFDEDVVRMFIQLGEMNAEAGTATKGAKASTQYKSTAEGGSFTFSGL